MPPPRASACVVPTLRSATALPIVNHETERRHADPCFASGPVPCTRAGRGHRRGLDGPSMPTPLKKSRKVFLHPPGWWRGEVGGGLFCRRDRRDEGHGRHVLQAPGRGPPAARGL